MRRVKLPKDVEAMHRRHTNKFLTAGGENWDRTFSKAAKPGWCYCGGRELGVLTTSWEVIGSGPKAYSIAHRASRCG